MPMWFLKRKTWRAAGVEHPSGTGNPHDTSDILTAACTGGLDRIQYLVNVNADFVNARDEEFLTPLHWAARKGQLGAAELLLASGADVNAQDGMGRTPLHEAAASGSGDVAELLIARGAHLNTKDEHGLTALHWAAKWGCANTVELLLSNGADPNLQDDHGLTPLNWAETRRRAGVIELLHGVTAVNTPGTVPPTG